jgi:hypothetical protein
VSISVHVVHGGVDVVEVELELVVDPRVPDVVPLALVKPVVVTMPVALVLLVPEPYPPVFNAEEDVVLPTVVVTFAVGPVRPLGASPGSAAQAMT